MDRQAGTSTCRRVTRRVAGWIALGVAVLGSGLTCQGPANAPPVALDQSVTTGQDTAISILLGATDAEGDALTFSITVGPSSGSLSGLTGATVTYTPNAGFTGQDSFTFTASDPQATSGPATVTITVTSGPPPASQTITADTTLQTLSVPAGTTTEIQNNARVTVTGDAAIDGTLQSTDGKIRLKVTGDLTINGALTSVDGSGPEPSSDEPLSDQPFGIEIVIGNGAVTFGEQASLQSTGPVVVTDDESILARTPKELFDEVEDVSADALPTLVPLPPENAAFNGPQAMLSTGVRTAQGGLPPITIGGVWPPPGAPAPSGDTGVVIFRFNGNRDLNLNNWTVNGPGAPSGNSGDESANAGNNASGGPGKNGLRLNIWNNGGAINIQNTVTLNLADGGDGGNASSSCASATGGAGGKSGNFRMTASSGIDISNGQLLINFGQSGKGGDATVTKGAPGATGCDGAAGAPATATGGKGADNNKRIFARGNVSGLENVTFSDLIAGDGGDGAASACDGGDGIACCAGGPGGPATATGGKGGAAALNVSGLPVNVGDALGGDGGEANATGGNGGNGGDCKFGDGGDGGAGGGATATAGDGGAASNTAGVAVGGDSQMATATGGDGGNGGDSGFGTPGAGGAAGSGTANAGAAGAATQAGSVFGADSKSGSAGSPGGKLGGTVLYCISFGFVQPPDGGDPIEPGVQKAPVFDEAGTTQVGTMDVEFVDIPGAQYLRGVGPDHVGLAGGQGAMDFEVSTLMLNNGTPGVIGGLRMAVLFANGVDEQHPLAVRALDGDGVEIGRQEFTSVPSSFDHPDEPSFFDALFNVEVSVATFRIEVPQVALVTPFRIYLLDP